MKKNPFEPGKYVYLTQNVEQEGITLLKDLQVKVVGANFESDLYSVYVEQYDKVFPIHGTCIAPSEKEERVNEIVEELDDGFEMLSFDTPQEPLEKSQGQITNTGSVRLNEGKLPMHLVPVDAIEAMARVLKYGMSKYEDRNWEKEHNLSVPYASLMRHMLAYWKGENVDLESGLSHLDHVIMNAAMLIRYSQNNNNDDRPKGKGKLQ